MFLLNFHIIFYCSITKTKQDLSHKSAKNKLVTLEERETRTKVLKFLRFTYFKSLLKTKQFKTFLLDSKTLYLQL